MQCYIYPCVKYGIIAPILHRLVYVNGVIENVLQLVVEFGGCGVCFRANLLH